MIKSNFSSAGTRRFRALLLSGAASVLASLAVAAPSLAAPTAPIHVEPPLGNATFSPHQSEAIDEAGDAVVIWTGSSDDGHFYEYASERPAGGRWTARQALSPAAYVPDGPGGSPGAMPVLEADVAMGPDGEAVATWARPTSGGRQVEVARLPSVTGTWESAVGLTNVGNTAFSPQVAIGPEGSALAVWSASGPETVESAELVDGTTAWTTPVTLSEPAATEHARNPEVGFDRQGDALVAWTSIIYGTGKIGIAADYRPAGEPFEGVVMVSAYGANAGETQIGFDGSGEATLAWMLETGGHFQAQTASLPAGGGAWSTPAVLDANSMRNMQMAENQAGDTVVVWQTYDGTPNKVQAIARRAGGSWGAIATIADSTEEEEGAELPHVALAADGSALLAFEAHYKAADTTVEFATLSTAGNWSEREPLSKGGSYAPVLVGNASGAAVGTWQHGEELEPFIYDPIAPRFEALTIPATGLVGQPLAVEAKAAGMTQVDLEWEFGDGATASGEAASHTYTQAGTYTITVRGEDQVGHVIGYTSKVTIAPAAGGKTDTTTTSTSSAPPSPAPPSPTPTPAPNWLHLVKVNRDKRAGDGILVLTAPGKGTIKVSGPGVKATTVKVAGKGTKVKLGLTPKGAFRAYLKGHRRGWTKVTIVYTPAGEGAPIKATRRVRLVKH